MVDPLIAACRDHIEAHRSVLWGQFTVQKESEKHTAALWLAGQMQAVLSRLKFDNKTGTIDIRNPVARD